MLLLTNYFVFSIRHFLIPRKGRFFDTKKVICAFVVTPNVSSDELLLTAKILRDDEEMFLDDLAEQGCERCSFFVSDDKRMLCLKVRPAHSGMKVIFR